MKTSSVKSSRHLCCRGKLSMDNTLPPLHLSERISPHVLVLSSPGKGHINPVLTLSMKLASLGLSITVCLPDTSSYELVAAADLSDHDIAVVKLPVEEHGEDQLGRLSLGWTMDGIRVGVRTGLNFSTDYSLQEDALDKLLKQLEVSPTPPCCVVVDMLLAWTEKPITKHGLPRFMLYTAAASFLPLILHARELYQQGILPASDNIFETMKVDGLPLLYQRDIPEAVTNDKHCMYPVHMGWTDHMLTSDGILFNAFYEFESQIFDALKNSYSETKHMRDALLPVGPLFPAEYFSSDVLHATRKLSVLKSTEENTCLRWLNEQPSESVVYVSFGSWALLTNEQAREVALGLEASKQRFLWVLPVKSKSLEEAKEILPEGFIERTESKGLVVPGWAPQHLILSHGSSGGFLTHCGWNSTLEALALAGVPFIGWPFLADQPPNCRYLVDGVGIGVELSSDSNGFVGREEISRAVREIMEGPKAGEMRLRAKEMKNAARRAVAEGGSSYNNLQAFVSKIKGL